MTNIRLFVDLENPTRVGVLMDVSDLEVMTAMKTEAAAEAMASDGVVPETLVILVEALIDPIPDSGGATGTHVAQATFPHTRAAHGYLVTSAAIVWWCGGQLHCDAERGGVSWGEGESSVVCLGDAFDDCEAEADAWVVGAYAFGAALKRFGRSVTAMK